MVSIQPTSTIDSVGQYLRSVTRAPRISHEEEIELGRIIREWQELEERREDLEEEHGQLSDRQFCELASIPYGFYVEKKLSGVNARNKMVDANMRLAISVAKRFNKKGDRDLRTLTQIGAMGLQRGAEKFDPTKGYRFSTYAYWWIRQALTRNIPEEEGTIRRPVHVIEKINKMDKVEKALTIELGRRPTRAEIAERMGIPVAKVEDLQDWKRPLIHLDWTIGWETEDTLLDMQADDRQEDPFELAEKDLQREVVGAAIRTLPQDWQIIIQYRFGFIDGRAWPLKELGKKFGLSPEAVRQIQVKSLYRMRKVLTPQKDLYAESN